VIWETRAGRDWNAMARAVLLLGMAVYLTKLLVTGQITRYIHPKFAWFTATAAVGFVLMAGAQIRRWFRIPDADGAPLRTGLYAAVLGVTCLGFLLQPHTFGADLAAQQGMNITNHGSIRTVESVPVTAPPPSSTGSAATVKPNATAPETQAAGASPVSGVSAGPSSPAPPQRAQAAVPSSASQVPPAPSVTQPSPTATAPADTAASGVIYQTIQGKVDIVNGTVTVTDKNFARSMVELYAHPQLYAGKRITLDGFTFYPPDTTPDEFAVTRLVVTCHVAHAMPDGLLAYSPGVPRPALDSWHHVEGVLEAFTFDGTKTLRIKIDQIKAIPQPTDPYVYP